MNQPQPTQKPKSYLKWLLVILAIVILAAVGVYFFYVKGGNIGGVFSLSSPTPTKSTAVSPSSSSGSTKTSTPSGGQTATPQSSPSATSRPVLPSGWQDNNSAIRCAGPCYTEFSIYAKNEWTKHTNDTAHTPVFFTANNQCLFSGTIDTSNCYDDLVISLSDPGNSNLVTRSYPLGIVYNDQPSSQYPKIYVSVNKSLSSSDQSLIFDSFRVTR